MAFPSKNSDKINLKRKEKKSLNDRKKLREVATLLVGCNTVYDFVNESF